MLKKLGSCKTYDLRILARKYGISGAKKIEDLVLISKLVDEVEEKDFPVREMSKCQCGEWYEIGSFWMHKKKHPEDNPTIHCSCNGKYKMHRWHIHKETRKHKLFYGDECPPRKTRKKRNPMVKCCGSMILRNSLARHKLTNSHKKYKQFELDIDLETFNFCELP